ncbi:type VI immunity family protein [Planobispora takensis]|uniref:Uncharacterized protein n=1 Tax=Planobispora takensis TaxID=1367882 RepID=A0A8J3T502_9ACTN|nr:type VI immunity family protein [Planobispora takensis]GII05427.1 hypothetical protein Pta02_74350 [Planobispora takensis]
MKPEEPTDRSGFDDLDLTRDGLKLVALTFGINLYTGVSFYDCPEAVLGCLDLFLHRCPPENLRFTATENSRVHKPVTERTLGLLNTWLKPGARRKACMALELKSGDRYQDAPQFKYEVWAGQSTQANLVSLAFPPQWGLDDPDEMLTLVRRLGEIFPFTSGIAGWSLECSRYAEEDSQTHAWNASMRHPGADVVRIPADARAPGSDAIKGVGWLTLVGADLLADLGGLPGLRARLPGVIELIECRHGVIIKAGPRPLLGGPHHDGELSPYRQVYQVLAPWIAVAAERSVSFDLVHRYVERTEDWFTRLGHTGSVPDRVDGWRAAHAEAQARAQRSFELTQRLGRLAGALDPRLLDAAAQARAEVDAAGLLWHLLPALAELLVTGVVRKDQATEWLDLAEEHVTRLQSQTLGDAAAVACAAGDPDRAIAFLRRAVCHDRTAKRRAKTDKRLRLLRSDERFQALLL